MARSLGVPRLGFSRLVPSGAGRALLDQMLATAQVRQLYQELLSLKVDGLEIVTGDPMAAQMRVAAPAEVEVDAFPCGGCSAGVAGLTILADGTVVPCRRLHLPLGKAGHDSLREIWAASPVLEALRDKGRYSGKCGACTRWADCRGCRASLMNTPNRKEPTTFWPRTRSALLIYKVCLFIVVGAVLEPPVHEN